MYYIGKYKKGDCMSDLICNTPTMLSVISIFNISLGFANDSIEQVCEKSGIDTNTFLAIVNLIGNNYNYSPTDNISIETLITYLKNSHSYFLDFRLPAIREKLNAAISDKDKDMGLLIFRYFDEYVSEVRKHMEYEDSKVFPYVLSLAKGQMDVNYNIKVFSDSHEDIDSKLTELKDIIIKYCPISSSNELSSALFDIFECAKDSLKHNMVEDSILIPCIKQMEEVR